MRHLDRWPIAEFGPEHEVPLSVPKESYGNALEVLTSLAKRTPERLKAWEAHAVQCAREINAGDFDVVYATNDEGLHTPPIGRHLAKPSLLYLHDPNRRLYEADPQLPWMSAPLA